MQKQIEEAETVEDVNKLQIEFSKFKKEYNNDTDLTKDFNLKLEGFKKNEMFVDEKSLSNLKKYDLKTNQELKVTADEHIILGDNGFELKLNTPEIKLKLDNLEDGQSVTIGRKDSAKASDTDIQMDYADNTVELNHLTITKQSNSYIVKNTSGNSIKIYSNKIPEEMNQGEIKLPSKIKKSEFVTLEQSSLENTIQEIQNLNNPKNKINITDKYGTIDFNKAGVKAKLIYNDGKLIASYANGSYYGYSKDGTRIILDEASYSKALNDTLIHKYQTDMKDKKAVDKTNAKPPETINQFEPAIVSANAHISLAKQCDIFLDTEPYKSMPDGQSIILGKVDGLYKDKNWSQFDKIADAHLMITKTNGKFVVVPLTDIGTSIKVPKRLNTPLTQIELQIVKGNKKTEITTSKSLDINDPMYNDIPKISEYLNSKMEKQMGVVTPEEISDWADALSQQYNMPKQDVLNIMGRLTQFGNYSQLREIGKMLSSLNIGNFYTNSNISMNSVLNYITKNKKQIDLTGSSSNSGFILDNASLKYLESLDDVQIEKFKKSVTDGNIVLVNLDGTGLEIGNNSYSYTALNGGQSLKAMTEAVIMQIKEGKNLDEVINGSHRERIKTVLGDDIVDKIQSIRVNTNTNNKASDISEQIRPNIPTATEIRATIDGYVEALKYPDAAEAEKVKSLLAKYVDYMLKTSSNDTFVELLKNKYSQIETYVKSLGKSMDDVIYIYPTKGKSFELVDYMYANVNNIDSSRIIYSDGTTKLPDGKVAVLLDDVVGSGATMITQEFKYNDFTKNNPNTTMIFSPITCAMEGHNNITNAITGHNRTNDKLLYDNTMIVSYSDFIKQLPEKDRMLLSKAIGNMGVGHSALCTAFQYMIPDNCSSFSGYLLNFNLNNSKANKIFLEDSILCIINDKIAQYGSNPQNQSNDKYSVTNISSNSNKVTKTKDDVLVKLTKKPLTSIDLSTTKKSFFNKSNLNLKNIEKSLKFKNF